ncbi:MAG: FAD binding domain-containing protein [Clostridia bacterium]|nr:FAD binding domain-containing protein [Clostridia bacterium]
MKIEKMLRPSSLSEAYSAYVDNKESVLMAGGVFLRLQKREVPCVIDLSLLALDYVKDEGNLVKIGAMTTLREIETGDVLPQALQRSVCQIGGIGLRNVATVGGSICGRYPFSDISTALLSLGAKLVFYKAGEVAIEAYLEEEHPTRDILIEVIVPKLGKSNFMCFKSVYTDFSLISVAVSYRDEWCVGIGSRPGGPILVKSKATSEKDIQEMLKNVSFGGDNRASGDYRKALAEALIDDAFKGVSEWK